MKNRAKGRAFSLVELVIVVVIIGVIAAIAVPRISRGARGAGDSSLRGTLSGIRNAIDMFAAEHGGVFPSGTETNITDQLIKKTDKTGLVGSPPVAGTHIYGPYLRTAIPTLPIGTNKGSKTLKIVTGTPTGGVGTEGWVYSTDTGQFIANCADTELDENGSQYNQY
ncbi:MAG: prepilin-type N-terminal cleavage/methylation domain-containing protein [Planctomycetota bacterium]